MSEQTRTFATYLDARERDQLDARAATAEAERDEALDARDVLAAQLAGARRTIADQAEQLRRNHTLIARLRDLDEQRDRAWADHDNTQEG